MVAGEAAQTAALLRSEQVDALSQFDTQYALTENAGAKLRLLDSQRRDRAISRPTASSRWRRRSRTSAPQSVALAQGYAMGTVFAIANPEAAIRILWEVYPADQGDRQGRGDRAERRPQDAEGARDATGRRRPAASSKWGENSIENYNAYVDFLVKNGVLKEKIDANDLVTNDLIDDINKFDAGGGREDGEGMEG